MKRKQVIIRRLFETVSSLEMLAVDTLDVLEELSDEEVQEVLEVVKTKIIDGEVGEWRRMSNQGNSYSLDAIEEIFKRI